MDRRAGLDCRRTLYIASRFIGAQQLTCVKVGVVLETKLGRRRDRGIGINDFAPEHLKAGTVNLIWKCAEAHSLCVPVQFKQK